MTKAKKIQKMATLAKKQVGTPKWLTIAEWNEVNAALMEEYTLLALQLINYKERCSIDTETLAYMINRTEDETRLLLKGRLTVSKEEIDRISSILSNTIGC